VGIWVENLKRGGNALRGISKNKRKGEGREIGDRSLSPLFEGEHQRTKARMRDVRL